MTPIPILRDRPLIYAIRNMVNGKLYIGKTKCIYRRCHQYIRATNNKDSSQINPHLLNALSKYGIDKFEMVPIEFVAIDQLADREIWWMNHYDTSNRLRGYNLRIESSTGVIVTDNTRQKISERLKKEWASGIRDGHSEKLKMVWKDENRRKQQSVLFSKTKTRYEYSVTHPDGEVEICGYSRLCELGLKSSLSEFYRKESDSVTYKGFLIFRYLKGER